MDRIIELTRSLYNTTDRDTAIAASEELHRMGIGHKFPFGNFTK